MYRSLLLNRKESAAEGTRVQKRGGPQRLLAAGGVFLLLGGAEAPTESASLWGGRPAETPVLQPRHESHAGTFAFPMAGENESKQDKND